MAAEGPAKSLKELTKERAELADKLARTDMLINKHLQRVKDLIKLETVAPTIMPPKPPTDDSKTTKTDDN